MYCRLFLLLFLLVSPTHYVGAVLHTHYIQDWSHGDYCKFKGYVPGGNKVIVQQITAPTAKMEAAVLGAFGSNMGKIIAGSGGGQVVMQGLEALKKFEKIAPKLGTALGVFGIGLGVAQAFLDPTPQDILDKPMKPSKN